MEITLLQIDAFASEAFKGNPAAVCLLDEPRPAEWMQNVAAEMNLSETAFVVRRGDEGFDLRWFTPAIEVPLCGHATLASAHGLWETGRLSPDEEARFHTLSGWLKAKRNGSQIEMDFPALALADAELPEAARAALGINPTHVALSQDARGNDKNYLVELTTEDEVRSAQPDFNAFSKAINKGVIITARSASPAYDFVSRYFATYAGIDEDPVTGSAHCALAPYWAAKLGKQEMTGYQASARGGVVRVRFAGDRVILGGQAVTVLHGSLLC